MEEQKENLEEREPRDFKYYILIFKAVFFALILCAALVLKLVGGNLYSDIKSEYEKYFCTETRLDDMFAPASEYSSFDFGYSVYSE